MRELTWVRGEVRVRPEGVAGLWRVSLRRRELSTVLVLQSLFWTTPSGATFSLLIALLYGVPALVLHRVRTPQVSGFYFVKEHVKCFSSLTVTF